MIGFEHYVSGGDIGSRLQSDPEELAYALMALFEDAADDLGKDVAEYLGIDRATVAANLRALADDIEAAQ